MVPVVTRRGLEHHDVALADASPAPRRVRKARPRPRDDERFHSDVFRTRLDRGMHDLRRDIVLGRPRAHRFETRAHAGVVRPRRGADCGKLSCAFHASKRFHHSAAVLHRSESAAQAVEQVRGEEPGVAVDGDAPALEPSGFDDVRHRVGWIGIVRVPDDAGEVRIRTRVVRLQPAKHQECGTSCRHREALERVVAGRLLATEPEDVLRSAGQVEIDAGRGEGALEAPLSRVEFHFRKCGVAAMRHALVDTFLRHRMLSLCVLPSRNSLRGIVALRPVRRHFRAVFEMRFAGDQRRGHRPVPRPPRKSAKDGTPAGLPAPTRYGIGPPPAL